MAYPHHANAVIQFRFEGGGGMKNDTFYFI